MLLEKNKRVKTGLGPEAKFETVGDDVPGMRVQARLGRFS